MNGHVTPRRTAARPPRLLLEQRPHSPSLPPLGRRSPVTLLLAALLLTVLLACLPLLAGCGDDTAATGASTTAAAVSTTASRPAELAEGTFPVTVTDDNGNDVTIVAKPVRIVSTAPSNTEILFALEVGDRVVGVTSLDDYPPEVADIAKIGDFQTNTEAVMALSPDLVVGYSGNEEALAPVQAAGAPVLILNPPTLEGIYVDIAMVGTATGATGKAAELVESIKAQISEITEAAAATGESPTIFYALDNTLWTAGPGSFVDELLALVSATNVGSMAGAHGTAAQAYYQLSPEQLLAADPHVILLPSTAYTSADEFTADARFASLTAVKDGRVYVVDDTMVTRPGPRIAQGLKILAEAIHPGAF
jgi:iron complex transport system substrate-binding protein